MGKQWLFQLFVLWSVEIFFFSHGWVRNVCLENWHEHGSCREQIFVKLVKIIFRRRKDIRRLLQK